MKITDDLPAECSEKINGKKTKNSILRCDFGHKRLSEHLITVRIAKCLKENAYMLPGGREDKGKEMKGNAAAFSCAGKEVGPFVSSLIA